MPANAQLPDSHNLRLAVIGLGYVGLPLAVEFAKQIPTLGFDRNANRVAQLAKGMDSTQEVDSDSLQAVLARDANSSSGLRFTTDEAELASCNVFIITVPTPVNRHNQPDFEPLEQASLTVGRALSRGDVAVYESTVFPGLTEDICVPLLEQASGLCFNRDFYCGYSPERINPGDAERRLTSIIKVTSGSTPQAADFVDALYGRIITAGTHKASSMRVAEASKVIENVQRDVNIALVNELAMIFNRAGIDTTEVLAAAGTKWNFLPFRPGLVGGHCIGVDPYYLTYKALELGYHPEMILAVRRINDNMASYIASELITLMTRRKLQVVHSRVLVLGMTFKENCPDIRNTKVTDIIDKLAEMHIAVDVYDPWVDAAAVEQSNFRLVDYPELRAYDAVLVAVAHRQFIELGASGVREFGKPEHVLYDVKSLYQRDEVDGRL
jgi:UDP-N-acetyl-D-galactosamine dehydrogenase